MGESKLTYLRLTTGLNDVGQLIPRHENPYNFIKDQNKDHYLSLYEYPADLKNHIEEIIDKVTKEGKKYKAPRGVSGIDNVFTNMLVFDFDSEDISVAQEDTKTLCARLEENNFDMSRVRISFSGNKGFSVVIEHDKTLSPDQHKHIARCLAGDLQTWDTKVYNASRVFRLDFTQHQSTGLYKTPISYGQLKSLTPDRIKKLASKKVTPRTKDYTTPLPDEVFKLVPKETETPKVQVDLPEELDFSTKPAFLTAAKFALHKGFIPPGYGNEAMMILASTYKSAGFDAQDALSMLTGVNEKRGVIYGEDKLRSNEEIHDQVIKVVYGPTWRGGTYSPKQNELLAILTEKFQIQNEEKALKKVGDIKDRFKKFITNINKNIIKTGIKSLDQRVMLMTGQLVGVLGAPGSGKTSLVTTIMENISRKGTKVLFESLDMHDNMMLIRILQKVSGVNMDLKIRKCLESDDCYDPNYNMFEDPEVLNSLEEMEKVYKNVDFNFNRGTTVEDIDKHIAEAKKEHGDELKLVIVDYLEKVPSQFSDATASTGFVARALSDLASKHDVCVLLLLQPQKSAGDAAEELLNMRKTKGASVIEQDCRVILTIWRPGFSPESPEDDKYASIAVVKNNMGDVCQIDFTWDGLRGKIGEMSAKDKAELSQLRQKRLEEKQEEKDGDNW